MKSNYKFREIVSFKDIFFIVITLPIMIIPWLIFAFGRAVGWVIDSIDEAYNNLSVYFYWRKK